MFRKRLIYLFIPVMIVAAYTFLYSFLSKPKEVEAQVCYRITLATCIGATCTPICPINGLLSSDIVNSGYTPGVYGVQMKTGLCFNP